MPDELTQRIRAAAADVIERYHVPGIGIAVVRGDDVVFQEGFGVADIESGVPMTPERRQCVASITKTMVGLCAMALVDEGKLSLDAKVTALLPDVSFDGPAESMTVRHLLTHSAGIGEAATMEMLAATVNPDQDAKPKPGGFASMYKRGIVIEAEPDVKWAYANHGFNLLGEIVSRAEGADLSDVAGRRIFAPLGMKDSDLLGSSDARLSTPYHRTITDDTRVQLTRAGMPIKDETPVDGHNIRGSFGGEFNKAALASGGAQSNIPDMTRYASSLLRHAVGIVRRETFDAMIAPQYCPDARLQSWGLSFQRTPFRERTLVGHGGAYFGGWNSHLDLSFDDNIAVVQHMNVMMGDPAPVFNTMLRAVFDLAALVVERRATDAGVLEQAPGMYELMPGRLTNHRPQTAIGRVHVEREGDRLKLRSRWGDWKQGVELMPADANDPLYFAIANDGDEPNYLAFTCGADGRIGGLRRDRLVRMVKVEYGN